MVDGNSDSALQIEYRVGNRLDLDEVVALYRRTTLGVRRPIDDRMRVRAMLDHANLVVTAWQADTLVGIARTLTDFLYVAYLADLAVDETLQRQGIGRQLVVRTREQLGPHAMIVLLAAPDAADYYPRIGFEHCDRAWLLPPGHDVR